MSSDEFAVGGGCLCTGIHSSSDAADIATNQGGNKGITDLELGDEINVGCLQHRIGCCDSGDVALGFDQPKSETA